MMSVFENEKGVFLVLKLSLIKLTCLKTAITASVKNAKYLKYFILLDGEQFREIFWILQVQGVQLFMIR